MSLSPKLSQTRFSARLDCDPQSVLNWEKGDRLPGLVNFRAICVYFADQLGEGTTPDEIASQLLGFAPGADAGRAPVSELPVPGRELQKQRRTQQKATAQSGK